MGNFLAIGTRLRQERERLGMSQAQAATLVSVDRKTLSSWETGKSHPTAEHLSVMAERGFDAYFIVVGLHVTTKPMTPEEERILHMFRSAPANVRQALLTLLSRVS